MRFGYLEPSTIDEATSLLIKYEGKAKIIAGGTDLIIKMRRKAIRPQDIINLGFIPGLDYIDYNEKKGLKIGALTTIRDIEKSPILKQKYSVISQAASQLASTAIRNMATIGGNLCNASPSADMIPALIGLSASVKIIGPNGVRLVLLDDFFTGPGTTVLEAGDILTEIQVPIPVPCTEGIYLKHGIRGSVDLAIVGVAAVITLHPRRDICQDIRVVLGAVAPTPMRARQAEDMIRGKIINEELINDATHLAVSEARPISDVRASLEYRREMLKVFTRNAITQALQLFKFQKGGNG